MKKRKYKYLDGVLLCLAAVNIQVPDTVQAGTWQQEENNWWYQEEDGIWPAWQWKEIDNKWYYFDENGSLEGIYINTEIIKTNKTKDKIELVVSKTKSSLAKVSIKCRATFKNGSWVIKEI